MTSNFKHTLHQLIHKQLPEFVRVEYPLFVRFLEEYYTFLDSSDQANNLLLNANKWNDIDETLDLFVNQLRRQHAQGFPESTLIDQRRLIKIINQFYDSKGSENATEIFFRLLFNVNSSVVYPGRRVLQASGSYWKVTNTIKLDNTRFTENSPFDFLGSVIELRYLEFVAGVGNIQRSVETTCLNVVRLSDPHIFRIETNLSEDVVFPSIISADPNVAETLGLYDSHIYVFFDERYFGSLTPQLVALDEVISAGSKFRYGESYVLIDDENNDAVIRLKSVLSHSHDSTVLTDDGIHHGIDILASGQRYAVRTVLAGSPYFGEDYMEDNDDYAVDVESTIPATTITFTVAPRNAAGDSAELRFRIGYVFRDSGRFRSNLGLLSGANFLQDNHFYQQFSYVVQSPIQFEDWKTLYKKNNHPAGRKVFGNVLFEDNIDLSGVNIVDTGRQEKFVLDVIELEETIEASIVVDIIDEIFVNNLTIQYFGEDYMEDNEDYASVIYENETVDVQVT